MATGHVYVIEAEGGPGKNRIALTRIDRLQRSRQPPQPLGSAHVEPVLNGACRRNRTSSPRSLSAQSLMENGSTSHATRQGRNSAAMAVKEHESLVTLPKKHLLGQVELSPTFAGPPEGSSEPKDDLCAARAVCRYLAADAARGRSSTTRLQSRLSRRPAWSSFPETGRSRHALQGTSGRGIVVAVIDWEARSLNSGALRRQNTPLSAL